MSKNSTKSNTATANTIAIDPQATAPAPKTILESLSLTPADDLILRKVADNGAASLTPAEFDRFHTIRSLAYDVRKTHAAACRYEDKTSDRIFAAGLINDPLYAHGAYRARKNDIRQTGKLFKW